MKIEPSHLELFGGPHSEPFGELRATGVNGADLQWKAGHKAVILEPDPSDATRVSVGAYEPVHTTVTARDSRSGQSATATLTVYIMDAPP